MHSTSPNTNFPTQGGAALDPCRAGGGRTRLPEFKFSAKFPIGLHVILQIQIKKKSKMTSISCEKLF